MSQERAPSTVPATWTDLSVARAPAASSAPSHWIVGDVQDWVLILATPLFVFACIDWALNLWTGKAISQLVVVVAYGHHLPGMMRAYGDRALFARYRTRFLVAPLGLLLVCVAATTRGHSEIYLITVAWGWWHYGMQAYGFARIYDAKVGSVAPLTQILDRAMCLTWFATPILLYSTYSRLLPGLFTQANETGLPILSQLSLEGMETTVAAVAAGVTGAFLINAAWQWSRGCPPSLQKLFLMATTFAFYWYSVTTVTHLFVAYASCEIVHDIQYLTIVWVFNRGRAKQDANLPAFTRFLFQPRLSRIALYVALIVAYGLAERSTRIFSGETMGGVWEGVFLASTMLHYYYDGFIWKLREPATQAPLEIPGAVRVGAAG